MDLGAPAHDELRVRSEGLRRRRLSGQSGADVLPEALDVCGEAIRRTCGVAPVPDQVEAARAICGGLVAQVCSGIGQEALVLAAYWYALDGAGVHVMSLTDALAEWHTTQMQAPLGLLGCEVGVVSAESTEEQRRAAYAAHVTCGSHLQLAADYLRGDLYYDIAAATQRGSHVLIVDDIDALLLERANLLSIVTGPRPTGTHRDVQRAAARLREGEHYAVHAGTLYLTHSGLASLKDELGWSARPDIATVQLASQVDSLIRRREGLSHYTDRAVLAAVTVREHARRYQTVCGLTSVAPPAQELERGYGLQLSPISPAKPPTLGEYPGHVYATDTDRLTDLTRRVTAAHEADRPVLIAVPSAEIAADVAVALDRARIAHHAASSGDEVAVLQSAGRRGAVTILDLDTCWPPPVGVDTDLTETATPDEPAGRGGPALLGLGLGSSRRQLHRLRTLVRGTSGEIWVLLSMQDPALTGADSRLLRWTLRHDPAVPDGSTLIARLISKRLNRVQAAAETSATTQRMEGWAYASVVQGQRNELLHTRRAILASSDVAGIVHRMIDEIVTDWAATSSAQELAPRIADLVPARLLGESQPIDGTEQARAKVHQAYQLREDELGATVLRTVERTVLITVIDMCWRDQLDVLRFLSQQARDLYGKDETLTRYQIDADHLGQELHRRVRYDSLRYLFELIVEPAP